MLAVPKKKALRQELPLFTKIEDVNAHIISFLDEWTVLTIISRISKSGSKLAQNETYWEEFCKERWPSICHMLERGLRVSSWYNESTRRLKPSPSLSTHPDIHSGLEILVDLAFNNEYVDTICLRKLEATPFMFYAAPEEESSWSMHNVESIEADMTLFRNDTKQMVYIGGITFDVHYSSAFGDIACQQFLNLGQLNVEWDTEDDDWSFTSINFSFEKQDTHEINKQLAYLTWF